MKTLIVEDEFTSRRVLQKFLSEYGETDAAVNGKEAIKAFKMALEEGSAYDLICLDIMMPDMDGQSVLKEIRSLEEKKGIGGLHGVKVIMTTALGDKKNVFDAFRNGCEAYVVKPVDKAKFLEQVRHLGLIKE
jgi:two-component system chemotaxis response regulator CheY